MTLLGVDDLKSFAIPVGWDAAEMQKFQLADGTTYDALVSDIAAGIEMKNSEMTSDPMYGNLISSTLELGVEYRNGTASGRGMRERTEYSRGDAQRGNTSGHMFPLKSYDYTLGWTFDFLRKARQAQIDATIQDALYYLGSNWEKQILTRFFSVTYNQLGTSGYDAPLVDGTTNKIDYTPPAYGQLFANTHTHFARWGTAEQALALEAGVMHLREHGIFGPYLAILPDADISTYHALDNFAKPDRGIRYIATGNTDSPYGVVQQQNDERFIGTYEAKTGLVQLWATPRLPTGYLGMYRPYGNMSMMNPLRIRYSSDFGLGALLMRGEAFRQYPLENAIMMHEFGVGVGNRLNGYLVKFAASGNYSAPEIAQ